MGASIEAMLEFLAKSLRDVKARIRPLFTQDRVAASANAFLDGLLRDERRKTGWMRADAAGDQGPWRQQAILSRGRWEADSLRDIVRDYVVETFADNDAVLVVDETGFLKQGKASCGVGRQYTGSAGKITSCQIGVFAAYVSRHGHAFIDRELYLPKSWIDDPVRLAAAHVPDETGFATKPQLAARMIARAITANVPFSWVAADSVDGVGAIEPDLRRAGKGYVLGVSSSHSIGFIHGAPARAPFRAAHTAYRTTRASRSILINPTDTLLRRLLAHFVSAVDRQQNDVVGRARRACRAGLRRRQRRSAVGLRGLITRVHKNAVVVVLAK